MNVMLIAADPVLPVLLRRPLEPLGHTLTVVPSAAEMRRQLHPVQPTERSLDEAPDVLHDLLERRAVGKIVLVP